MFHKHISGSLFTLVLIFNVLLNIWAFFSKTATLRTISQGSTSHEKRLMFHVFRSNIKVRI